MYSEAVVVVVQAKPKTGVVSFLLECRCRLELIKEVQGV